jgi:hypothetical protein
VSWRQRVVVVLLDVLDEGVVLEELLLVSGDPLELGVLELLIEPVPEAPMELVLPEEFRLALPLVEPGVVLLLELVSRFAVVEGTVVVVDELDAVDGVPSRFVQAPSETAATMARAAHVVFDAFIRKLLEGLFESRKGGVALGRHSRQPPGEPCRFAPLMCVGQTQRCRLLARTAEPRSHATSNRRIRSGECPCLFRYRFCWSASSRFQRRYHDCPRCRFPACPRLRVACRCWASSGTCCRRRHRLRDCLWKVSAANS